MRGPLPQSQKLRTNTPTYANVVLPGGGRKGRVPKPPTWVKLGDPGLAWWRWAWRTPQATQWDASAEPLVARRAGLEDQLWETHYDKDGNEVPPTGSLLKAILDLDDRLGLSPKALAQLRWVIDDGSSQDEKDDAEVIDLGVVG